MELSPSQIERADQRLQNWCRAMRDSKSREPRGRCGGIESRYVPPPVPLAQQVPADRAQPRQPSAPLDLLDAAAVETLWRGLPLDQRIAIRMHDIHQLGQRVKSDHRFGATYRRLIAQEAGVSPADIPRLVVTARAAFKRLLANS